MSIVEELASRVQKHDFKYLVGDFTTHMTEVVNALNVSYWAMPGSSATDFRTQVIAEARKWLLAHDVSPENVARVLS